MNAGTAKINITPFSSLWMDGMIRKHKSEGVHDQIFARALVMSRGEHFENACAVVSVEVCALKGEDIRKVKDSASIKTGIPSGNIIIAATHTHSGPATIGFFNPSEPDYLNKLLEKLTLLIMEAAGAVKPVLVGYASGHEDTISHYRRLLADDGHVVMNWETYPSEKIIGPLGEIDPEVGVLKLFDSQNPEKVVCIIFNHAGHPNVMSGENYLISGDYPGLAATLLEDEFGGIAMFLNGAQGSVDIDGLRDRDWEGVERTGKTLAAVVSRTAQNILFSPYSELHIGLVRYTVPPRRITESELRWAEQVLETTGGTVQALADGVGDDYKALLIKRLHESEDSEFEIEQTCFAVNDCAFLSFPGELFTEIGMHIKEESLFFHTYIIGLANGNISYVPTRKAIHEGGYAVDTRTVGDEAEEIIVSHSLELLEKVYRCKK